MIDFRDALVSNVDRKQFDFNLVDRYELDTYEEDGKRYYYGFPDTGPYALTGIHPYISYKSVTTVIGEHADKTWLKEWKDRVGEDEAAAIMQRAKHRGNAIHDMAEAYFMGEEYWQGHGTINITDFNRVIPLLNRSVSSIYGVELPLFSHRLRTAGRTDLVCQWDGINSVVDFKTARKEKFKEQITDYFIQSACYAIMFQELYNLTTPQIVVIMLIDHEPEPIVFIEKTEDWVGKVEEMFTDEQRLDISSHTLRSDSSSANSGVLVSPPLKTNGSGINE